MKENGIWRTIRGHKVFIRDGESPIIALKKRLKESKSKDDILNIDENGVVQLINKDGTVNKEVALLGTNPKNGHTNCQRTAAVYARRLQGDDISAKLSEKDLNSGKADRVLGFSRRLFEGIDSDGDWTWVSTKSSGIRQISKDIKDAGDGAIFLVRVSWNKNSGAYGSSHQFVGRNEKGSVIFEDPQNRNKDCISYITKDSLWGSTAWVRVDGKEIKDKFKDLVYENN